MYNTPLVECSLYDVKRHGDVSRVVVWLQRVQPTVCCVMSAEISVT